ncbi:MAG: lytic transglycosylase domain-containing protein, partial [Pseudomonadota bacterium]
MRGVWVALACLLVAACSRQEPVQRDFDLFPNETPELRQLINKHADSYEVPRLLVHKVVQRESD